MESASEKSTFASFSFPKGEAEAAEERRKEDPEIESEGMSGAKAFHEGGAKQRAELV